MNKTEAFGLPPNSIRATLALILVGSTVATLLLRGSVPSELMLLTGIGWYVGQIEPDCFTPLVVIGGYLLLFHAGALPRWRLVAVIAITGFETRT